MRRGLLALCAILAVAAAPAAAANRLAWHPPLVPALPAGVTSTGIFVGGVASAAGPQGQAIALFQRGPLPGSVLPRAALYAFGRTSAAGLGRPAHVARRAGGRAALRGRLPGGASRPWSSNVFQGALSTATGTLAGGGAPQTRLPAPGIELGGLEVPPTLPRPGYWGTQEQIGPGVLQINLVAGTSSAAGQLQPPVVAGAIQGFGAAQVAADAAGNQTAVWEAPDGSLQTAFLPWGASAWTQGAQLSPPDPADRRQPGLAGDAGRALRGPQRARAPGGR